MALLLFYEAYAVIFGIIIGFYAVRRNRNGLAWGLVSGIGVAVGPFIFQVPYIKPYLQSSIAIYGYEYGTICFIPWAWIAAMVVIALLPALCPRCKEPVPKKHRKDEVCLDCGSFQA
jgi:Na+(H+)/acetate symporter ActP